MEGKVSEENQDKPKRKQIGGVNKRENLTLEDIEKAFTLSKGIVSDAARKLKVSRQTLYEWMKAEPEIEEFQKNGRESLLDFAEGKLITNIRKGKEASIIFALKTIGRNRGYVERIEYAEHTEQELFPDAQHDPEAEEDFDEETDQEAYL